MLNQPSSSNTDKAKQMAKDLASQAKAKFNKYKDSGNMAADADKLKNKAKEFSKTEKAMNIAKAVGSGALAVLITGQGGKMMDLNSKANTLNEMDKIAVAERTVSDNAVLVSKNQIANYTQNAGFGQKPLAQQMKERSENIMNEKIKDEQRTLSNLQDSSMGQDRIDSKKSDISILESNKSRLGDDSKDLTSHRNQVTMDAMDLANEAKNISSDELVKLSDSERYTVSKVKVLQEKLQEYDSIRATNQIATDKYVNGDTMNPAIEATQKSQDAQGDAAKTFIIGAGGAAFALSRKNKGEKPKAGPETEPTPNPEPTPGAQETVNVVESAIEPKETIQGMTQEQREEIEEVKESFYSRTKEEENMENKLTGFTAEEYGPKEAPKVEVPVPAVAEVKKEDKKGGFLSGVGKLATRFGLIGLTAVGGGKAIEQVYGMANADTGAKIEMTKPATTDVAPQATTESKIDIASEGTPDEEVAPVKTSQEIVAPQATTEAIPVTQTPPAEIIPVTPPATTEKAPEITTVNLAEINSTNPEYIAAKSKIESFAKESGLTSKVAKYNKNLVSEMLTNMSATKEKKSDTMTPAEKSILEAKISAWNDIRSKISSDTLYVKIAKSGLNTYKTAVGTNPESVFTKIKVDSVTGEGVLNTIDIANINFDGAGTFGGQNPSQAGNLAKIASLRSK